MYREQDWKVEDYLVSFPDTWFAGALVDAPIHVKAFWVQQYVFEILKAARRCLMVDAEIPSVITGLATVDYIAGFNAGHESRGTDYVGFVREYFPNTYEPFVDAIYSDLRCGLMHNLVTKNPWRQAQRSFLLVTSASNHLAVESNSVVWSVATFLEHIGRAWAMYAHAVIMNPDASLDRARKFTARFDRLAGTGAFLRRPST